MPGAWLPLYVPISPPCSGGETHHELGWKVSRVAVCEKDELGPFVKFIQ